MNALDVKDETRTKHSFSIVSKRSKADMTLAYHQFLFAEYIKQVEHSNKVDASYHRTI